MSTTAEESATPVMQQFLRAKEEHKDALLFFRMGDFYELFYEDAKVASRELGITLTARSKGDGAIPMAGVPVRSYLGYLQRLVKKGFKVAICEQMSDPKETKGLVERAVVRVVTAGTLTEENLLEEDRNNYLLALCAKGERCGLAWVDVSTGRFLLDECDRSALLDSLSTIAPSEILMREEDDPERTLAQELELSLACVVSWRGAWEFDPQAAERALQRALEVRSLEGFGVETIDLAVRSAGALASYLEETQRGALKHLHRLERFRRSDRLVLDRSTAACLELTRTLREGKKEGTLLSVLDATKTAMGARLLREWLAFPLVDVKAILERQGAVSELFEDGSRRRAIREHLRSVQDLERLAAKIATERANARDLVGLRTSLQCVPPLRAELAAFEHGPLAALLRSLDPLEELSAELARALVDDPPMTVKEGGLIRPGYSAELDELHSLQREGQDWIARFEREEQARSGIANLKVGFNRVFGYYVEVTRSNLEEVPAHYIRRQTVKNAERFITPELKEYENKILKGEELAQELEHRCFLELRRAAGEAVRRIQSTARAIAELDVYAGLAEVANARRYVAPTVDTSEMLVIDDGRHPVIEAHLPEGAFVPNDLTLECSSRRLSILTGPNMSGKSTYIRQAALITLMAQIGSFVPAAKAHVGVVDRIFTRIGSADDLTRGSSTFMVEMIETANILNCATRRSLVILDEVGRGTSTFDGLSIAWAVCEHLHEKIACRALFATHYHELTDLADRFHACFNQNVAVHERGDEVVFLHRIQAGGTDRSYGIHVARLAGIPRAILDRAREILERLEDQESDLASRILGAERSPKAKAERQLSLFEEPDEAIVRELRALDPNRLAPIEALQKLLEWRARL
ncbi:MAG: DNA mismatch repair protein MutS [Planctomycetes bacterium]|nr:DNA mismatch repair protein MutS [Planctomycetota bacterium]